MNLRVKKIGLVIVAAGLLAGSGWLEESLNLDRAQLGLTISAPLQNAPPILAFTTVALGGFRGLISNYLWIRANDLQQDDKFFEAVQLADWTTDLEPHFPQVWVFQAWNMAWNISVKFSDPADRWRWVQRGMELLRDDSLRYNPDSTLLYQWLGWIFQSKIGQNNDDANLYYKQEWAREMTPLFGPNGTNFSALINPQTPEAGTNALLLREKYKIDPVFAQKVDAQWGPLDWRLPEAHAIYWYALGLEKAKEHPGKVNQDDLITLRRGIYQSMRQAFLQGRLIADPFDKRYPYALEPNLDFVSNANDEYEKEYAAEPDPGQKAGVQTAQRNFLRTAVYFLYENDRIAEAEKWFRYLGKKYPDKPIIDGDTNSFPRNLTLDRYAVAVFQEDINDTSQERVTSAIEGLLTRAYYNLAIGQDDRCEGLKLLAGKVYQHYQADVGLWKTNLQRSGLPPFAEINRDVLNQLLDPRRGLPFAARAVLRTQLGLPAETNAPPATISTNAITPSVLTNTNVPALTNK
jgi:hypothetical protein